MIARASALELPSDITKVGTGSQPWKQYLSPHPSRISPPSPSQVTPKGDLILAKVAEIEDKTTGGILLPTAAQRRPTSGDVVAVGDGRVGNKTHEFSLKAGDTVLYSKFGIGATDLLVKGEEHILIREDDVIGIMPRSGAIAGEIPELRPIGDRVLVKIQEQGEVTMGGVVLPDSAKERPMSGTVVRTGAGATDEDGKRKPCKVKEGDSVVYFKWAGDAMETPTGDKYVVLHESDILCKTSA
jgi:chaperonin GroES